MNTTQALTKTARKAIKTQRRLAQVSAYQDIHGVSDAKALDYERKLRKWCRNTPEQYALGGLGRDWVWFGTATTSSAKGATPMP